MNSDGLFFPLRGMRWSLYQYDLGLRGADDGEPGRGGWGFRRSLVHIHQGIDLRVRIGHAVLAVEDGVAEYRSAARVANGTDITVQSDYFADLGDPKVEPAVAVDRPIH